MEQNSTNPQQNTSAEQTAAAAQGQETPKKKNKKPIIIAAVIAAIALIVGGILLFKHLSDNDSGSKKKDRKKTDSSAMDDEKLDLTDYDFNGEETTEENIYTDGPEESVATQLGVSYDDNGDFQALGGNFDTEVLSEYDALDFLNEYSDQIGISDVYDELELLNERTFNDITYYKFQQMLDDVPVYGNQLIVSVNKDGIVSSVSGGYSPVDVDTDPSIDQTEAENIAKEHIDGESEIISSELIIRPYTDIDSANLMYDIRILGETEYSELFIDADSGDIITENDLADKSFETVNANFDGRIYKVDLDKSLGGSVGDYLVMDSKRDISVSDASGRSIVGPTIQSSLRLDIFNGLQYDPVMCVQKDDVLPDGSMVLSALPNPVNPASAGDVPVKKDPAENKVVTEIAIKALSTIQNAYDYYDNVLGWKSIDGKGMPLWIFAGVHNYDPNAKDLELLDPTEEYYPNSSFMGGTNTFLFGAINNKPISGLGITGHEFTHGVVYNTAQISDDPKPSSINEGYADVMGAIISGDWLFIKKEAPSDMPNFEYNIRNPIDPNKNFNPDKVGGTYYLEEPKDEHVNATIVSHSAYLMSENGLSNEKIANIFLNSLFRLSSYPDFEETAHALLYSSVELGYTREESKMVAKALRSTNMLPPTGKLTLTVHCGSHSIPDAVVTVNGEEAGRTDENGNIVIDYDPENFVGTLITVKAEGFRDLSFIALAIFDDEKTDCNLAVADDFGASHGSDAPISDGSKGEKVKVTIMDMAYDNSNSHAKPKGQDYYVLKGSRISLYKLVDAMKEGMDKVKDKDPELGALMGDISTDGTKIYFNTGYMPVELTYHIYGTDEVFDFSKPITEDVVIEPVVGIGDFGLGDFSFNGEDLNDLADQLDSMFNGGGKK